MSTINEATEAAGLLIRHMREVMAGYSAPIQGAVLAELLATWLAGHFAETEEATKELRESLLSAHLAAVHEVMPVMEKEILRQVRSKAQ